MVAYVHRPRQQRAGARLFLLRGRARSAVSGQAAYQGRGAPHGGQLRQAAGFVAPSCKPFLYIAATRQRSDEELPLFSKVKRCRPAQKCLTEVHIAGESQAVAVGQIKTQLRIKLSADQSLIRRRDRRNKGARCNAGSLGDNIIVDKCLKARVNANSVNLPRSTEASAGLEAKGGRIFQIERSSPTAKHRAREGEACRGFHEVVVCRRNLVLHIPANTSVCDAN